MLKNAVFFSYLLLAFGTLSCHQEKEETRPPNVIIILADDLGYGDLSCYQPHSKIKTVHLDRMASQGIRFTDAHSSSSVCTPTRYGLLTGRYAWRTHLKSSVLWQWDPPLLENGELTLPQMLKEKGYATAAVGKWHLGWNWPTLDGELAKEANGENIDYSKPITGGPTDVGFDYYFGDDVPNFPPYTFIENDKVLEFPTVDKPDSLFGIPGKMAEGWKLDNVLPTITEKAVDVINRAARKPDQPFFLYFSLTAPHTPIAPSAEYINKSEAGPYGDFVMEVDGAVGKIMEALEINNISENTLLVFLSDNGSPARDGTNYSGPVGSVITNYGHAANGKLRGFKADIWEAGHRVPFIVKWPGKIEPGVTNDQTICSIDLMATLSSLIHYPIPLGKAGDSFDILPLFYGKEVQGLSARPLVHHSHHGVFALRQGPWKLILSDKSGGFSDNLYKEGYGIQTKGQLYNMTQDLGEQNNLYAEETLLVDSLSNLLQEIIDQND
ncbi:MAG: arylsulfatase [Cyclobacteriaceae bacterium]